MKTNHLTTLIGAVSEALRLLGYRQGPPPWAAAGVAVDRQVCGEAICGECGRHGLDYHPFHRPPGSYMAYAVCPSCRVAEEM